MSIGSSGRIVIEIEPESKRLLYAALARDGMTLKDWFLKNVENYMTANNQLPLSFLNESSSSIPGDVTQQSSVTLTGAGK
ncbi:hypothetical protein [Vogesella indigofera]|uniref:hypothetical protein n=1 Tax=Vogesella indigofera TaxID=45465 RepID=UPI00234F3DED|nr:hypothetical protein [Vogesella indigofera]MDC7707265.1 hypothetical protein [Vogesella indigofera]